MRTTNALLKVWLDVSNFGRSNSTKLHIQGDSKNLYFYLHLSYFYLASVIG